MSHGLTAPESAASLVQTPSEDIHRRTSNRGHSGLISSPHLLATKLSKTALLQHRNVCGIHHCIPSKISRNYEIQNWGEGYSVAQW